MTWLSFKEFTSFIRCQLILNVGSKNVSLARQCYMVRGHDLKKKSIFLGEKQCFHKAGCMQAWVERNKAIVNYLNMLNNI